MGILGYKKLRIVSESTVFTMLHRLRGRRKSFLNNRSFRLPEKRVTWLAVGWEGAKEPQVPI